MTKKKHTIDKKTDRLLNNVTQKIQNKKLPGEIEDLPLQPEYPESVVLFGPEFKAYGALKGGLKVATGLAGSNVVSNAGYKLGTKADDKLNTKFVGPALGIIGGLGGYAIGSGLTGAALSRIPKKYNYGPVNYKTYLADDQTPRYNSNQITGHFGKVKYYGPTMGKTTAAKLNSNLVDFDDIIRQPSKSILDRFGFKSKSDMYNSGNQEAIKAYEDMLVKQLHDWRANPLNEGKTLMASPVAIANPEKTGFYFDNMPSIPSRDVFIARNINRGGKPESSAMWYDSLIKQNPNLKTDNRFVSQIEYQSPELRIGVDLEKPILNDLPDFSGVENLVKGNYGYNGSKVNVGKQSLLAEKRAMELYKSSIAESNRNASAIKWYGKPYSQLNVTQKYWLDVNHGGEFDSKAIIPRNQITVSNYQYPKPAKITEAERLGIHKSLRSNSKSLEDPYYWGYKQWNNKYNSAVESGNIEEAQRLRDMHFKTKAPDTKAIDENKALIHLYHGTGKKGITSFDITKRGSNTGKGSYIDPITGNSIPIDSENTFSFSSSKNTATSYRNLARWQEIEQRMKFYNNIDAIINNKLYLGHNLSDKEIQEQRNFIDNTLSPKLGYDLRKAINSKTITDEQIQKLNAQIKALRTKMKDVPNMRSVSNQRNNLSQDIKRFKIIEQNKNKILSGEDISDWDFDNYNISFVSGNGSEKNGEIYEIISKDKENGVYVINGKPATKETLNRFIENAKEAIRQNKMALEADEKLGGYDTFGDVIDVYANIRNPLIHDYNGSPFPDKYVIPANENDKNATRIGYSSQLVKPLTINGKYIPTGYVAARQVQKAINSGNDAVIYKNVVDPFLSDTYGVFNPRIIKFSAPITRTNTGEIIPIVKRDNFHNLDMRYKQGGILKGQNGIPSIENVPSQTDNTSVKTTNPYKQRPIDYISEYFNYDVAPRYLRENPNATQQEIDAIKNINVNTKQVVRNKLTNPNYAGETYVNTTSRFFGIPWRKNPRINYSPTLYNEGVQAHELTHAYRQGVLGKYIGEVNDQFGIPGFYGLKQRTGYNGVESNYLNNAYDSNGLLDQQRKWVEKGTTNSELRYILWKKLYDELGRRPSLQETDDYIRNYNDENLLNELYDLGSSYSNRYYMNHLYNYPDYTPKEDTNTSNIKDALIHVASNDKKLDMTNLAKNGIKI